jgi:putative hydrolases of HD superfamily
MRLGLFHELCEIHAGDFTPQDKITPEDKFNKEYDSIKKTFSKFQDPDKYINIWLEFEKKSTPEAVFVKQIDKLEMALQANLYERLNYNNLDEFFLDVKTKISSPELKGILEDIIKAR